MESAKSGLWPDFVVATYLLRSIVASPRVCVFMLRWRLEGCYDNRLLPSSRSGPHWFWSGAAEKYCGQQCLSAKVCEFHLVRLCWKFREDGGEGRDNKILSRLTGVSSWSCTILIAKYPGLLTPAFVTCSTNVGEGLVKLIHVQWCTWILGGREEEWHIHRKTVNKWVFYWLQPQTTHDWEVDIRQSWQRSWVQ